MLDHILITLDGSELAEQALAFADRLTEPGGKITLLSVVDIPDITVYGVYPVPVAATDYDRTISHAEAGAREYVNRQAVELREKGFDAEALVVVGSAPYVIAEVAQEQAVDAIVMSTHGRSGFRQWLFGSVTQKVLTLTQFPVFVVPGFAAEKDVSVSVEEQTATM